MVICILQIITFCLQKNEPVYVCNQVQNNQNLQMCKTTLAQKSQKGIIFSVVEMEESHSKGNGGQLCQSHPHQTWQVEMTQELCDYTHKQIFNNPCGSFLITMA